MGQPRERRTVPGAGTVVSPSRGWPRATWRRLYSRSAWPLPRADPHPSERGGGAPLPVSAIRSAWVLRYIRAPTGVRRITDAETGDRD